MPCARQGPVFLENPGNGLQQLRPLSGREAGEAKFMLIPVGLLDKCFVFQEVKGVLGRNE